MYHRGKTIQPDHTHAYDLEQQFARRFSSNDYVQPHGLCNRCNETCQRSPALRELLTLGFVRSNRDLPRNRSRRGCFAQAQGDDENDHLELLRRYSSLKELEESYLNSCHFCALILHTMDPRNIAELHKHARIAKSSAPIVINIAKVSPPLLIITSDVEPFQNRQHVSLLASEDPSLRSGSSHPYRWSITTASHASFALAKSWIRDCISNHSSCSNRGSSNPDSPPTRLLAVGPLNEPSVRLHITTVSDPLAPYLTLSHVWGDANILKLQVSTIDTMKTSIPLQDLPQTFQDAITITRRLGYEYIWIDSLCIIQDSPTDWMLEATRMATVYGNSSCNIAAVGANSHAGCYVQRNPLANQSCRLFQGESRSVYAQSEPRPSCAGAPLFDRAWVLQERLLSPRNIYYGASELCWECCSCTLSEDGPFKDGKSSFTNAESSDKRSFEALLQPNLVSDDLARYRWFVAWRDIMRAYCREKLTFPTDRLIALQGLANFITQKSRLTYAAGMWKECLPSDLLWSVKPRSQRPKVWRAPTWSWASVEAFGEGLTLELSSIDKISKTIRLAFPEQVISYELAEVVFTAEVVDIQTMPRNGGALTSEELYNGALSLRGPLRPMILVATTPSDRYYEATSLSNSVSYRVFPDIELYLPHGVLFLLIARCTFRQTEVHEYGVMLVSHGEVEGDSERVGYFHNICYGKQSDPLIFAEDEDVQEATVRIY